ncbi:oligosaccharide flippase family protein [Ketobacter sp. MCCC 1A13808]|nr:oligosaccharide flippase family protein [Ketobacter sp. MCCC 1A13808]
MSLRPEKAGNCERAEYFYATTMLKGTGLLQVIIRVLLSGVMARIAQFLAAAVIARQIDPEGYGTYIYCMGTALLLAQVTSLGWHPLSTIKIPELRVKRNHGALAGFLFASNWVTAISALTFVIIAILVSILDIISENLRIPFIIASVLAVPMSALLMKKHQLIGFKKAALGIFFAETLIPGMTLFYALFVGYKNFDEAIAVLSIATILCAALVIRVVRQIFREWISNEKMVTDYKGWILSGLPLFIGTSSKLIMARMDVLMLAPLSTFGETGLFGAAFRLTYLMTFPQAVLLSVVTPLMSECFSNKKNAEGIKYFYMSFLFSIITAIPCAALLIGYDVEILNFVYGEKYILAKETLALLAIAQVIGALSIPLSCLLMTAGRSNSYGVVGFIGLVLNITLNFSLIPSMAGSGAAISSILSNSTILMFQSYLAFRLIKSYKIARS